MLNLLSQKLNFMGSDVSLIQPIQEKYGHDLYEYLLVVHPDADVYEKVMAEKKSFYAEFKEEVAIKTKPHITIAGFLARESMEETMIRWIQRICSRQKSFTVILNN